MRRMGMATTAIAALAMAGAAAAAVDASAVVKARQANFKVFGQSMKGIADQLKAPSPSIDAIHGYAQRIDGLAPHLPSWFPAGSGPDAGVKTAARPDIWAKPAEFGKDAAALAAAAKTLDEAAGRGDLAAVRTDFAALGETCKTCHQSFRVRER